jgi:hypothetical protein
MAAPIGNQNAKKGRMWAKALEREIARLESGDLDAGLARIARRVVAIADAGDPEKAVWAFREIGDRMDGKPAQAIIGGDEDDPSVKVVAEVLLRGVNAASG